MATQIPSLWTIRETEFPRAGTPREKLLFALTYAVLAPSKSQSQPWQFRVGDSFVDLVAEPDHNPSDPDGREATMACGASLLHLRLALAHFGCHGKVEYERNLDEPERLARVHLGSRKAREPWETAAFHSIPARPANGSAFLPRLVEPDVMAELKGAVAMENAWLDIAEAETTRTRLLQIVEASQRRTLALENYSRASSRWSIAVGLKKVPAIASPIAVAAIRWLGLNKTNADQPLRSLDPCPVLAVLKTKIDDRRNWLQAGQALERLLLHAYARGLSASFLNEPIQCKETRSQLQTVIGRRGFAQVLLQLGYPQEATQPMPTVRREAESMLR